MAIAKLVAWYRQRREARRKAQNSDYQRGWNWAEEQLPIIGAEAIYAHTWGCRDRFDRGAEDYLASQGVYMPWCQY